MATNITDGTAIFKVRNKREQALIDLIYPVGTIYTTEDADFNPNTAWGGTWVKTAQGRLLEGATTGHDAGATVDAGLPNITGHIGTGHSLGLFDTRKNGTGDNRENELPEGAIDFFGLKRSSIAGESNVVEYSAGFSFNASRSNPIYGSSDTVQPAAEFVIFWKRTA